MTRKSYGIRSTAQTQRMLQLLIRRAEDHGIQISRNDLINYMIESQYPDVYRHVMYGEPLKNGTDSEY